jgi:hypothetical protein
MNEEADESSTEQEQSQHATSIPFSPKEHITFSQTLNSDDSNLTTMDEPDESNRQPEEEEVEQSTSYQGELQKKSDKLAQALRLKELMETAKTVTSQGWEQTKLAGR